LVPAETQIDVEDEKGCDGNENENENEKGVCGRDEMKSAS
jgi:hypothetical protein